MKTQGKTSSKKAAGSGVVEIAVFRESAEAQKYQDVFTQHSSEVFYDFSRALKLMDGPGWGPQFKAASDEGFFVFTSTEKF